MCKYKVVIGTVQGDLHDIGKNLVAMAMRSVGLEVVDLGVDVPPQQFVGAVAADPDVALVAVSALLTTTLPAMEETIRQLRALPQPPITFVGGAVVTPEYAKQMGADYYAKDARQSVEIARKVLG